MKQTLRAFTYLLPLFIYIFTLIGCSDDYERIIGQWERYGEKDPYKGMIIEIERVGEEFQARIIKTGNELELAGFRKGDIKWRGLSPKSDKRLEGENLVKASNAQGEIANVFYEEMYVDIISDDILYMSVYANTGDIHSDHQTWKKRIVNPELNEEEK